MIATLNKYWEQNFRFSFERTNSSLILSLYYDFLSVPFIFPSFIFIITTILLLFRHPTTLLTSKQLIRPLDIKFSVKKMLHSIIEFHLTLSRNFQPKQFEREKTSSDIFTFFSSNVKLSSAFKRICMTMSCSPASECISQNFCFTGKSGFMFTFPDNFLFFLLPPPPGRLGIILKLGCLIRPESWI